MRTSGSLSFSLFIFLEEFLTFFCSFPPVCDVRRGEAASSFSLLLSCSCPPDICIFELSCFSSSFSDTSLTMAGSESERKGLRALLPYMYIHTYIHKYSTNKEKFHFCPSDPSLVYSLRSSNNGERPILYSTGRKCGGRTGKVN